MNLILHVWRQAGPKAPGKFVRYEAKDISSHASFLEMLDIVNERLAESGEDPIAFEHDCREGICGACGIVIDGAPHGPSRATTTCQPMRSYKGWRSHLDRARWRANAFPVLKDLVVDRSSFDRIVQAGGFVSVHPATPDITTQQSRRSPTQRWMPQPVSAGAYVAACPNASAMLTPPGRASWRSSAGSPERYDRARRWSRMDQEGCPAHQSRRSAERLRRRSASISSRCSIRIAKALSRPVG